MFSTLKTSWTCVFCARRPTFAFINIALRANSNRNTSRSYVSSATTAAVTIETDFSTHPRTPSTLPVTTDEIHVQTPSEELEKEINHDATSVNSRRTPTSSKLQKFVDYKVVRLVGGRGGDGAISFERSTRVPFGPPNGGNGGRGGDVFVVCSKEVTSLNGIRNRYAARPGENGRGKSLHGKAGNDVEVLVPIGTILKTINFSGGYPSDLPADDPEFLQHFYKFRHNYVPQEDRVKWLLSRAPVAEQTPSMDLNLDLTTNGERHLIAKGGRGGLGNPHFSNAFIRGPAFAGRGEPGREVTIELELKTIADAGLVGLPNAGKSTFLSAVSAAHPRIAPYPFTTLNPYIGTIDFPDFWTMTLADMPGLIKGAHRNVGLGHTFLRHIERSKMFVYVVDLAKEAPWRDLDILRHELEAYKPGLTKRPSLVIANKADLRDTAEENFRILRAHTDMPVVPVSALEGKNITVITGLMRQMVESIRREEKREAGV
ncbi:hypothetical protein HK102_001290 [Quaeritorhiza haematococci]|nr:hypothetical protein HK102_001290 [Quaeritorhiza haematococci]